MKRSASDGHSLPDPDTRHSGKSEPRLQTAHATLIRPLMLAASAELPQAPRHLSAASGMVVAGSALYVIADDELHLGVFDAHGDGDGSLLRLFPGNLPDNAAARKAEKPDLEALVRLPSFTGYPHGALLALASGSRPNRRGGVLLGLDGSGCVGTDPLPLDLSGVYSALLGRFPELNIEGAVVNGHELTLLQRGGKAHPACALISFSLADFLHGVRGGLSEAPPLQPTGIRIVDLGTAQGAILAFTDGAALPDGRIAFSAVAEDTGDSYVDGACVAAAVGIIGIDGRVELMQWLEPTLKIEGIHALPGDDRLRLLLVTDADDASVTANLLSVEIPLRQPPCLHST